MLKTAITPLKQDIFKAIKDDKVAKALETALLTTFPNSASDDPDCKSIAENFGKVAAVYLAGALTTPICEAIDKYVHDIGIQISPKKLISPHGPVSGIITTDEVTIL